MFIERLYATGAGLFEDLKIEFNSKFNFIIGPNSSGKTTILKILALCYQAHNVNELRYSSETEFWTDFVYKGEKMRIGLGKNSLLNFSAYHKAHIGTWNLFPEEKGRRNIFSYIIQNENLEICPIFFGAYRKIDYLDLQGVKKEKTSKEERQEYLNKNFASLKGGSLPNVKQWLINRYFQIDKDWADIEKINWQWLFNNIQSISPENATIKFVKIERDLQPVFEINGMECYLEELSSGFQAIMSLVLGIVDWIEKCNEGENRRVSNAVGSVIIDELDAHLHPEWQFVIRDSLEKLFPNLQFIITTHSPHLVASAKENEVIILPTISRHIDVKPSNKKFSGWDTESILTDLMGVKNIYTKDYNQLLDRAFNLVEEKNKDQLREVIDQLKSMTSPNDSIIESLEIKYAELLLNE